MMLSTCFEERFVCFTQEFSNKSTRRVSSLLPCPGGLPSPFQVVDNGRWLSRGRRCLKRVLIFGLLGPAVAFITAMWVMTPLLNWALGDAARIEPGQLVLLPLFYFLGFIPACLAGLADEFFARRAVRMRVVWTTLSGFALSFLPFATAFAMGFIQGPFVLLLGLVGAIPAAVCSWVAGRMSLANRRGCVCIMTRQDLRLVSVSRKVIVAPTNVSAR